MIAVAAGLIAIAAPIAISIYWAWKQNLDAQFERTASIAVDVLRRTEESSIQVEGIVAELVHAGASDPCSPQNTTLMGKLALGSEQVQAVGYVKDDTLLCSSHGHHNTSLGPPTYTTPFGGEVRPAFEFPLLPGKKFLVVTHKATGYSVVVHPNIVLDVPTVDSNVSMGVYALTSKRRIVGKGAFEPRWVEPLGKAQQVQFIDGENLVVVRRSTKFDFAAFAVLPSANVNRGLRQTALILVPIGVLAGGLLALVILYLARQQLALPAVIKVALKRKEFFLHYQPIVDLQTGAWVGAEALIRWRRQNGEMVPPDMFIAAAEEAGLIRQITAQVMEMVGQDAHHFFERHPDFHIAINLSAADLESRETIESLTRLAEQTGARRGNLLVEATERGFMRADLVKDILRAIQAMGGQVAIDDFGTGYSSLSYLETFELDYLKIDKSFVDTLGKDAVTSQVVPHIIEMAKSLKLAMIAEGVETEAQAQYLREHGVQFAQGWLFAKAMPFAALVAGLSASKGRPASPAQYDASPN